MTRLDQQTATDLYTSGAYLEENPDWHAGESEWKARAIARMLDSHGIRPSSVADVGCGTGDVLALLQATLPAGARLTGYDIAPKAIELAQHKANDALSFEVGMPDDSDTFDLMLILDVIEHLEDGEGWLRSIRGKAAYTILHLPLDLTVHRVIRPKALNDIRRRYGHLHFYNREVALSIVRTAGFEIVDSAYTEEFKEGQPNTFKAGLISLPRRMGYAISPDWSVRLLGGCRLLVLAK